MRALLQAGATASLKSKKDVWRFPANKTAAELAAIAQVTPPTFSSELSSRFSSAFLHNAFSRREVAGADGVLPVRACAQGWDGTDRTSLRLQLESTAEEEARTRQLQQIYDARTAAVAAGAAAAKAELVSGAESRGAMEVGADEEAAMVRQTQPLFPFQISQSKKQHFWSSCCRFCPKRSFAQDELTCRFCFLGAGCGKSQDADAASGGGEPSYPGGGQGQACGEECCSDHR